MGPNGILNLIKVVATKLQSNFFHKDTFIDSFGMQFLAMVFSLNTQMYRVTWLSKQPTWVRLRGSSRKDFSGEEEDVSCKSVPSQNCRS